MACRYWRKSRSRLKHIPVNCWQERGIIPLSGCRAVASKLFITYRTKMSHFYSRFTVLVLSLSHLSSGLIVSLVARAVHYSVDY